MNLREEADKIYNMAISTEEKINKLKDLELDCMNELEAQDQNMSPETRHRLSEGLRKVRDYLNALR